MLRIKKTAKHGNPPLANKGRQNRA